ncbi:MAG: hypothetical protein EI684_08685 [Candidatus Viridilinea halotolerans]|uniref:Polyprenyl synthetase n=1 Tax=Candidatus Viridilinea halotolerans TaxID=2491704 RepID=A0A426U1V9_9CHLR|nr:MAG: hypothetical protein EI684_08685 [Candidatus Viridilinea halotolerans]
MILTALPAWLLADVDHVAQLLHERMHARAAVIRVACPDLFAEGHRLNYAALVLLAAQTGQYQRDRVQHAAAAAELIAAATQTHDGLVDRVERRRSQRRDEAWAHPVELMVGDYLFALAAGEMALSPDARVISLYAQAVTRITESTLMAAVALQPLEQAQRLHLAWLGDRHGALYGAACRAGGVCAGVTPAQVEALGVFGEHLGVAWHVRKEVDTFAAQDSETLPLEMLSLPVIFAAHYGDGERVAAALEAAHLREQQAWLRREVEQYGLAPARNELQRVLSQAQQALEGLPAGPGREALAWLVGEA